MRVRLEETRSAALLFIASLLTACASQVDPAALEAQQAEVNALLAANQAFGAQDYKTAFAGYLPWAEKGDDFSEARIGYMYYVGLGVAKDEVQARHWYEKAAQDGHLQAATDLGYDYLVPDSGQPDYAQALKWFTYAADRGDLLADLDISILYEHGLGVQKDHDQALHWLNQFVARQDVPGYVLHFKYSGGDNSGGFMIAMNGVIAQAAQHAGDPRAMRQGPLLSFHYAEGRASNVTVARSSGDPVADASAVDFLQKTLLPPVLPSLSHLETFTLEVPAGFYKPGDREEDHVDFFTGVRNAIDARKVMPKSVIVNGSKGEHVVRVEFDYLDGQVLNARVVTSSGNTDEDAAAVDAVNTANYPPTPSEYAHKKIHMAINIRYENVLPAASRSSSTAPTAVTGVQ